MKEQEPSSHASAWLQTRLRTLKLDVDAGVLTQVLHEVHPDELENEEVLKMWLGLSEEDVLPEDLRNVVASFRQLRLLEQYANAADKRASFIEQFLNPSELSRSSKTAARNM
eukprot:CAMPEP_0206586344 /NCGR_PEP_ID=MMETSP0325_2-20121206/36960_1 /ASSEMBLY_ACC=CAM_ASM_000347 /TAXON_ID=2866 /ORGANISM="Crypthecodinium cohnii, Strain Seligo" /LENGTH=111 /DNA_ID=CAMNT_0054094071 /DNA_START=39 /DNA_END=374 /DNA_ORIENTATION=+